MKWIETENTILPVKSWCETIEDDALKQARNLANHPALFHHVALMPDCHVGYGMPIGGVIACENAVIPNAVGVDIGCGMGAIETGLSFENIKERKQIRRFLDLIKSAVPVGEGNSHAGKQKWEGFSRFYDTIKGIMPGWYSEKSAVLDAKNLGSLGGGNHFMELQKSDTGKVWLMLHSGSRNLGYRIASYYHGLAVKLNESDRIKIPDRDLSFLDADKEGKDYIRDMNFALDYARENRRRMMAVFKDAFTEVFGSVSFMEEINIHHNYAVYEEHFERKVWVHRKGATSAHKNQPGIIPGSMGTSSYIVRGLGNPESFMSCSHGAVRVMGRKDACRRLSIHDCDMAMEGIVFDRWKRYKGHGKKGENRLLDLSEAPLAYKNIDQVIEAEMDLIEPVVRLSPLGVVKG